MRIYIREYRKLKAGQPVRNDTAERLIQKRGFAREVCLEINPAFSTPVTYGIIHPKIVLPSDLEDITRTDLRNMMFHELIHIQRCDVVKRHLMILLLCVYWFNPLIWIMFFLYQSDQEMSCDECVIRSMEEQRVKSYIQIMIKMSVEEKGLLAYTGFRGKLSGKKRILAAMRQRSAKRGKGWAAAAIVLCLCPALLNAYRTSEISGKGVEEVADLETIQPLLRIEAEAEEPFDYQAVMKDIEENYNDLSQPLTQEQELALTIQRMLRIQEIKERAG